MYSHGLAPKFMEFFGNSYKYGVIPVDDHIAYWFSTYNPSDQDKELEEDPIKMKQYILSKLREVPDEIKRVFKNTELKNMVSSPLRFRHPWELLTGKISKDNVCVAGDAFHAMTPDLGQGGCSVLPDLGQGGCSVLEDSVVLARVLGEALKKVPSGEENIDEENEQRIIRTVVEKFVKERRLRGFELVSTAYFVGFMQQNDNFVVKIF